MSRKNRNNRNNGGAYNGSENKNTQSKNEVLSTNEEQQNEQSPIEDVQQVPESEEQVTSLASEEEIPSFDDIEKSIAEFDTLEKELDTETLDSDDTPDELTVGLETGMDTTTDEVDGAFEAGRGNTASSVAIDEMAVVTNEDDVEVADTDEVNSVFNDENIDIVDEAPVEILEGEQTALDSTTVNVNALQPNGLDGGNSSDPLLAKIEAFKNESLTKGLVAMLSDYETQMSAPILEENMAVGKQYELFSIMRSIAETEDVEEFTKKMDLLNLFFIVYKDSAFSEVKVSRFDFVFPGSDVELSTFLNLGYAIANLADKSTRAEALKEISLDKVVDANDTVLSVDAGERIKNYYQM